ncbi:recombinase family protein [Salegentibacter mishustinae]|uniref:Transposase n=1 Tax=Salegentibacter mishustinae TaxID=270918 RepID=A0A0Q9Z6P7_9FLAO|nr:recombinase family protein [Salegentibacter mishustinae]KRG28635.1 transposase [Salegentibacter mishustinae]PNW22565.1 transposase [Salegentibacter mishustinae]PZX67813.1 DNA invertase Pin-like site-specific DNA recombinase [Salegentibacter mishustinae]GGW77195.1 resolvase [Salegentibacter mishustinae]
MKKARYNRISSPNQKLERQLVRNHPDELIYNDVVSGAVAFKEREKGQELMKAIEEGTIDFVSVAAVDRLGRNLYDVITTLEYFTDNGVVLRVDNLGIESMVNGKPNQVFKLIVSVLGNVAEMERENLRERQLEGIAIAKANGRYKGRVRGSSMDESEFLEKYSHVVKEIRNHQDLSLRKLAKLTDTSLGTVQKVSQIVKSQNI